MTTASLEKHYADSGVIQLFDIPAFTQHDPNLGSSLLEACGISRFEPTPHQKDPMTSLRLTLSAYLTDGFGKVDRDDLYDRNIFPKAKRKDLLKIKDMRSPELRIDEVEVMLRYHLRVFGPIKPGQKFSFNYLAIKAFTLQEMRNVLKTIKNESCMFIPSYLSSFLQMPKVESENKQPVTLGNVQLSEDHFNPASIAQTAQFEELDKRFGPNE